MIFWEGGSWLSTPCKFLWVSVFCWNDFSRTKNQSYARYSILQFLKYPRPQVQHKITCYQNYSGGEVQEEEQNENQVGVCCKSKG